MLRNATFLRQNANHCPISTSFQLAASMPPRMSGSRRRASRCSSSSPCSSPISLPSAKEFKPRKHSLSWIETTQDFNYLFLSTGFVLFSSPEPHSLSTARAHENTSRRFIYMQQPARACRLLQAAYCLPLTSCSARGSVCSTRQNTHTRTHTNDTVWFFSLDSWLFYFFFYQTQLYTKWPLGYREKNAQKHAYIFIL